MSFGLLVQNSNGGTVIDQDFQNHYIAETGTVSTPGGGSADNVVTFSGSYAPSRQPLLFGRCTGGHICFQQWTFDGAGNITGFKYGNIEGSLTFNWMLAVTPSGASSDTFGLQVLDAGGNIVFDSGFKYLKIVDVISVNLFAYATGNFTHASATTPYYCWTAAASWARIFLGGASSRAYVAWQNVNGSTGHRNYVIPDLFPGSTNVGPIPSTAVLLVADAG